VSSLKRRGYWVRGVDLTPPQYAASDADEFELLDLRRPEEALRASRDVEEVYALAADMGGMGFISQHGPHIFRHNLRINVETLEGARANGVRRYLYTSSACVYPVYRQRETSVVPLREADAYPAQPENGYGWEKLMSEMFCQEYWAERNLKTFIARFHNVYGPNGTWDGGREKAPAALARNTREVTAAFLAAGIDPKAHIVFNQSQVHVHAELAWVFNCVARMGWLNRMTQFKEKAGKDRENASVGLFAYPSLMAADILAYLATHVPVGDDQKQHLELARDIAIKFNNDFAESIAAHGFGEAFFPVTEPLITGPATISPANS
jgi:hypothetical protein